MQSTIVSRSAGVRVLLAGGVVGPLLNIVVLVVLGSVRPGYRLWRTPDSALELGAHGWLQITNYIVCGALVAGFAAGLRRTGRGPTPLPILVGSFGVSLVAIGIFVTDPVLGYPPGAPDTPTVHGVLHDLFSQALFGTVIAACFVLARRDDADPARRGWARYSRVVGWLVVAADVVFVLTAALVDGGPAGLVSLTGIAAGWTWIAALAVRALREQV